eukprot:CAMPEP_0118637014 /NCGR_PEP_ID=MMETSP0785-20121206/2931_1 /TAXON_ID=91992 /ORGANISM="Bolidomonas pacifica, Strain CCMP 1866" /LENGTH=627 /DNA_ID=CAMNT_0006528181 /DNA_START=219 /DNA_END=2103 /DNA_ORIENTATION=+
MALPSGFLASLQFLFAVIAIAVGHVFGFINVDPLTPDVVYPYMKYCVLFLLGVYSNMQSLAQSSVDTVIVFRSSTPLLVCLMDVTLMGRANPSKRSMLAMLCMVLGATLYVLSDSQFKMGGIKAYFWVLTYFVIISLEMIFGKKITFSVKCTLATSVLLTNLFTLPAMLLLSAARGESWSLDPLFDNPAYMWVLVLSSIAGTGIGFSSWWCRSLLSATSFTVVGICNKILTVILNIMVWDKHASPFGTCSLLICLAGGIAYQQAPLVAKADIDKVVGGTRMRMGNNSKKLHYVLVGAIITYTWLVRSSHGPRDKLAEYNAFTLYRRKFVCIPPTPSETETLLLPPDEKTKFLHHGFEGRLGNQLFECASAAGLGALHGMQTCFPYLPDGITYEGSVLTSNVKLPDRKMDENGKYATHNQFSFHGDTLLVAFLQSYKYFLPGVQRKIRFKANVLEVATKVLRPFSSKTKVGIHVRERHTHEMSNNWLRFPPDSYFEGALSYFRNKYDNVQFVVASDNPNWCSEQSFFQSADVHIVIGSYAPVVDMAVLAACDHNIITVGSFGWWTAFLGADAKGGEVVYFDSEFVMDHPINKGNVVVADFYPSEWIPMGGGGEETFSNTETLSERRPQ